MPVCDRARGRRWTTTPTTGPVPVTQFLNNETDFAGSAVNCRPVNLTGRRSGAVPWHGDLPTVFGPIAITYNTKGVYAES